jgi:hypothetical protein
MSDSLQYPIGPFEDEPATASERRVWIADIAECPGRLRAAVDGLTEEQLDTPYRPGGWTVRQVVHHIADAHMNWYVRTKLALAEEQPTIRPFGETEWAELAESRTGPIEPSLALLDGLCGRWALAFGLLGDADWNRTMNHPERGLLTLDTTLAINSWHSRHHTAHITELRKRSGW